MKKYLFLRVVLYPIALIRLLEQISIVISVFYPCDHYDAFDVEYQT